jgi:hypothetical protein
VAQFPCSHCGEKYKGPQQTAYPSIVNGTERQSGKQRLCPSCLQKLDGWTQERMVLAEVDEPQTLCVVCQGEDPDGAVFMTVYRHGQEREDWYGRLHMSQCMSGARMAFFGSTRAP